MNTVNVSITLATLALIGLIIHMRSRAPENWTYDRIVKLFERYKIDWRSWKSPEYNTMDDLMKSVLGGEIWPEETDDGRLILHINVSVVSIYCNFHGIRYHLREYRHKPGQGELYERKFSGSMGEKCSLINETFAEAALRGIREELGIHDLCRSKLIAKEVEITAEQPPDFYPLPHVFHRNHFDWEMPTELFQNEYTCIDAGRNVIFRWKRVGHAPTLSKL